jgi:hypothetical protein
MAGISHLKQWLIIGALAGYTRPYTEKATNSENGCNPHFWVTKDIWDAEAGLRNRYLVSAFKRHERGQISKLRGFP